MSRDFDWSRLSLSAPEPGWPLPGERTPDAPRARARAQARQAAHKARRRKRSQARRLEMIKACRDSWLRFFDTHPEEYSCQVKGRPSGFCWHCLAKDAVSPARPSADGSASFSGYVVRTESCRKGHHVAYQEAYLYSYAASEAQIRQDYQLSQAVSQAEIDALWRESRS